MSQPVAKPIARPRRGASRAPSSSRLGDENTTAAPRLAAKASTTSLGPTKRASSNSALSGAVAAVAVGKAVAAAPQGARRALNEVTNARGAAERNSKDLGGKVTRSRTASSSSTVFAPAPAQQVQQQPPSSTGTGISRLKIVGAPAVAAPKARRAPSRVTADDIAWHGSWEQADETDAAVERLQSPDDARAQRNVGLGFSDEGGRDAVAQDMYEHPPESSPSRHGLKRHHSVEDASSIAEEDGVVQHEDKARRVEEDEDDWMVGVVEDKESEALLEEIKAEFKEELDFWDTTMVAEYAEEIFEYMGELEESAMPNPRYMDFQTEIEWGMRTTLIDWLLQVHLRYHLVPETLWIAVNIIDRFLSNRIVSLVKFQLVGVTAMFIAAKYEEIMAPSVDEFVYMTEGGYTREEILKGERIILSSLEFSISPYCSPYTWVRRISKADDYDIQTRTLSKFLMEVTLLDQRFLRAKPSMIAAIGMYLARRMLGGEWNDAFIYYSSYTEAQLLVPTGFLVEQITASDFDEKFVYKKYASKKFLKASLFARNWATANAGALFGDQPNNSSEMRS